MLDGPKEIHATISQNVDSTLHMLCNSSHALHPAALMEMEMPFGATEQTKHQPCPVHKLLTLDGKLFVESCEVVVLEGEAAQQIVAECLAGDELELAS